MKELRTDEMAQVEGGLNGAEACGIAIGLSFFWGGPIGAIAAVGFCFLANPSTAS